MAWCSLNGYQSAIMAPTEVLARQHYETFCAWCDNFHLEYPHIRIRISNNTTRTAMAAVKNGEVDFAVVTTPAEADAPLRSIPLLSFREVLVGGRTFTALASQILPLSELKHYSLIGLDRDTVTYSFYEDLFFRYHLEIEPDIQVATTDQLIALVRNELGLAFIPEPLVRDLIAQTTTEEE